MVSLGHLFIFANLGKVSCLQFCSFLTENGWISVDQANWICFKYNKAPSSWWDAARSCEEQGLFLARPDNEGINEFIQTQKDFRGQHVWIGGINSEDSGWKWTNGDEMGFTDFDPLSGTTNRIFNLFFKKSTSCAMYLSSTFPFKWKTMNCDDLAPYLCQSGRNTTLATPENGYTWLPRIRFSDSSTMFWEPTSKSESLKSNSPATVCFVFFEKRSSWWDANKICHEQNMSLVTVNDATINDMLEEARHLLAIDFWIGAINKDNTGWKWANGDDMVYTDFDRFIINWDRVFKQTLCGVRTEYAWAKQGCDKLYPFVCQFYSYSTITPSKPVEIHGQTTSANTYSTVEIREQTTSAILSAVSSKKEAISVEQHQKVVGGHLHPKLIYSGQKKVSVYDVLRCCRLCSLTDGCTLVNFCKLSRSCALYGNYDSAVSGGVTSEDGCSIYVAEVG